MRWYFLLQMLLDTILPHLKLLPHHLKVSHHNRSCKFVNLNFHILLCYTAPEMAPQSVQVYADSPRSVIVSWDSLECLDINGPEFYYVISYSSGGVDDVEKITLGRITQHTVTELKPFTNYTFQVIAANSEGSGPPSASVTIETPEDSMLYY